MRLIIKETFVTIKRSFKRFISILLIVLLGVGFYAGIKATSPDMKKTINEYYTKTKFQDIELLSTWGVTEEEINNLNKKGYAAFGYYSLDAIVRRDSEEAVKVLSYNENKDINKLILVEGRFPQNENECVIDLKDKHSHKIGDTLTIDNNNLKIQKLKIVGIVKSPIYTSLERGSTDLLSGKINYFIYTLESNFDIDYYTNVGVYLDKNMYSDSYDEELKNIKNDLEKITEEFKEERYNEEKNKALDEYNNALEKFKKEKKNTLNKISHAKKEIANAKTKYNNSLKELDNEKKNFENTYKSNLDELDNNKLMITEALNNISSSLQFIENEIFNVEEQILLLEEQIKITSDETTLSELNLQKESLTLALSELQTNYNNLLNEEENLNVNLAEIEVGYKLLDDGKTTYENKIANATKELNDAKTKINASEKEISKSEKKANEEFKKAENELANALEEIESLKKPEWYILDRETNIGFYQYNQDVERIKNLGQVFPLVFFVVAVLICLTSMTRMVEEERSQLGTLKSLGFTNGQILLKYILYALIATLIGSAIGLVIGFNLLPNVIFMMYQSMYNIGDIITEFNIYYAMLATGIALACTLIATIFVCVKSLKEQPSSLLRPKAIKSGKRILLERIPFIWKNLDFNHKVTMRNVFRYKKRMLMTIVGIAGCTGLIIAGFGLKDCLGGMVTSQYENIFKYDLEVTLTDTKNNDDILEKLKEVSEIKEIARVQKESVELKNYDTKQQIQLVASLDNLDNFIGLQNRETKNKINLTEVVVTEKLANLLKLEKNDILKIRADKDYNLKVSEITENYLNHYLYINKEIYNSDKYNTLLINTVKLTEAEENALATKLKEIDGISKLTFTSRMADLFDETMKNFEYVVIVLIVAANLLAFVVLYNLASVNMSERIRELATIKVLGFYDKEVFDYIGRETTILTSISMIFGAFVGRILTTFVIKTCELDIMMFNPVISPMSYIYGFVITIMFTIVVNITTYFALKKIKMVESLKSVE